MKRIAWIVTLFGAALIVTGCSDPSTEKPGDSQDSAPDNAQDNAQPADVAAKPQTPADATGAKDPGKVIDAVGQALRKSIIVGPAPDGPSEAPAFEP